MKLFYFLLVLIILLQLSSCDKKRIEYAAEDFQYEISIDVQNADYPLYDSLVHGIEYLPLETNSHSLLGDINDIVIDNNGIIINSQGNKICCFDKTGKFKFHLGDFGNGPGEYITIHGISVQNGMAYLYDSTVGKILSYNISNGEFLKQIKLPQIYAKAYVSGDYIYAVDYLSDYTLVSIPIENQDKINELFVCDNKFVASYMFRKKITASNGRLFWTNPLNGEIFELRDGKMYPFIRLNFGSNHLPVMNEDEFASFNKSKYAMEIGSFLINDSVISFSYFCGNSMYYYIHNFSNQFKYNIPIVEYARKYREQLNNYQGIPFATFESNGQYCRTETFFKYSNYDDIPKEYETYKRLSTLNEESNPYVVMFDFNM